MPGFFKRHNKNTNKNTGKNASASSPKIRMKRISKESPSPVSFNVAPSSMKSPVLRQNLDSSSRANGENTETNGDNRQVSSNSKHSPGIPQQHTLSEFSAHSSDSVNHSLGSQKSRQRSSSYPINTDNTLLARTSTPIHQQIQNIIDTPSEKDTNDAIANTPTVESKLEEIPEARPLTASQLKRELTHTPWRKKRLYNSPFPRFSHATSSSTSDTGAIYLMGGLGGKNVFGDMWIIEPVKHQTQLSMPSPKHRNDNYSYVASPIENFDRMPAPRIGHACVLIGNAFIIFAGDTVTNSSQVLDNKLYFFNITSLKWTVTKPIGSSPSGRYGHQIAVLNFEVPRQSGRWLSYLYVFGGQLEDEYYSDIWKFNLTNFRDPKTSWVKIDPSKSKTGVHPPPLANHTMTAFEDKLYVYGGFDGKSLHDDLLRFDPVTEDWTKCDLHGSGRPPALQDHAAALYQNLLFVYGGKLENDRLSPDLYIIDLKTYNCWRIKSDLLFNPGPRCGHSLTADIVNEKLVIMGGDGPDKDFTGIYEDTRHALDESQFSFPSSVIYEFDLRHLSKFMEKDDTLNSIRKPQSRSPRKVLPGNSTNVSNSTSLTSEEHFTDANDIQPDTTVDSFNKDTSTKISLDETSGNGTVIIKSPSDLSGDVPTNTKFVQSEDNSMLQTSKEYDPNHTPINSDFPSEVKTPERAPDRPVMELSKEVVLASKDAVLKEAKGTEKLDPPPKRSELTPTILPATSSKVELVGNDEEDDGDVNDDSENSIIPTEGSDATSDFGAHPHIQEKAGIKSAVPRVSQEISSKSINSELTESQKLLQMADMIRDLKKEMHDRVNDANNKIIKLEDEKREAYMKLKDEKQKNHEISSNDDELASKATQIQQLQEKLKQLQMSRDLDVRVSTRSDSLTDNQKDSQSDVGTPQNLTASDKVGYENKILKLQNDNLEMKKNFEGTITYIKSELMKAKDLNSVVQTQQKKMLGLQKQLVGEAELKRKVTELEGKYKAAEEELMKLRLVYGTCEDGKHLNDESNEMALSDESASSQKQFFDFQPLLDRLNTASTTGKKTASKFDDDDDGDSKDNTIRELQSQVDRLLDVNKDAENQLKSKLETQDKRLKELEEAYKNSVSSLNNTHRALTLSQSEMDKLKDANRKLSTDLDELKLKRNMSPKIKNEGANEDQMNGVTSDTEEDFSEVEAQYSFKIKDLEAELFIASQERDKMREELVSLKKKIYTSPSISASARMQ